MGFLDRFKPKEPEHGWLKEGHILAQASQPHKALKCYERVLAQNPRNKEAWFHRGIQFVELEDYPAALECFNQLVKLEPQFDGAWNNRGICLEVLGQRDEALKSYDQALAINPNYELAWLQKGNLLAKSTGGPDVEADGEGGWRVKDDSKQWKAVLDCYEHVLQTNPQSIPALMGKVQALNALNRVPEALGCLDVVLRIDPSNQNAIQLKSILGNRPFGLF
jgi:tetratricopeptide (TPR) repeat protein